MCARVLKFPDHKISSVLAFHSRNSILYKLKFCAYILLINCRAGPYRTIYVTSRFFFIWLQDEAVSLPHEEIYVIVFWFCKCITIYFITFVTALTGFRLIIIMLFGFDRMLLKKGGGKKKEREGRECSHSSKELIRTTCKEEPLLLVFHLVIFNFEQLTRSSPD